MHHTYNELSRKSDGNEPSNPFFPERNKFDIVHKGSANLFDVYLSEAIDAPEKYAKLVSFLRSVTQLDEVRFYINCPGGRVDAGLQLLNAIQDCEAHVVMILDGEAYSMAAYFMFAGDEIVVNDNSMLMIHNYSGGQIGKGGDLLNSAEAYNKLSKKLMKKYFSGFLTEQEMADVLNGKDMYLDPEEMAERIKNRKEYLDGQITNAVNELNKALEEHSCGGQCTGSCGSDVVPEKAPATKKKAPARKKAPAKKAVKKRPVGKTVRI